MSNLENFDFILQQIENKNIPVTDALGKHVHWGYWPTPFDQTISFNQAAENLTRVLCDIAKVTNGQAVLDVGCGFGGTIDVLNKQHSNLNITGMNIDDRQLEVAKKNIISQNNNMINLVLDDACQMHTISNQYDHIIALESIFYFSSRKKFLEHALKHLKPGGSISLSDFVMNPFLIPSCKFLNIFNVKSLHPFGALNLITLNEYYNLCKQYNLLIEVFDINHNTIPTYDCLYDLMSEFGFNKLKTFFWRQGLSLLKFFSYIDFNRYLIIKLTKG